jgi:hypothetical protein
MLIALWALTLFLLLVWSGLCWAAEALWSLMAAMPWGEAVRQVKTAPLPAWVEAWLGPAWRDAVDAVAPALQALGQWLQGSAQWLLDAVPLLIGVVWGLGVLMTLLVAAAASSGIWLYRRHERQKTSLQTRASQT